MNIYEASAEEGKSTGTTKTVIKIHLMLKLILSW